MFKWMYTPKPKSKIQELEEALAKEFPNHRITITSPYDPYQYMVTITDRKNWISMNIDSEQLEHHGVAPFVQSLIRSVP